MLTGNWLNQCVKVTHAIKSTWLTIGGLLADDEKLLVEEKEVLT